MNTPHAQALMQTALDLLDMAQQAAGIPTQQPQQTGGQFPIPVPPAPVQQVGQPVAQAQPMPPAAMQPPLNVQSAQMPMAQMPMAQPVQAMQPAATIQAQAVQPSALLPASVSGQVAPAPPVPHPPAPTVQPMPPMQSLPGQSGLPGTIAPAQTVTGQPAVAAPSGIPAGIPPQMNGLARPLTHGDVAGMTPDQINAAWDAVIAPQIVR